VEAGAIPFEEWASRGLGFEPGSAEVTVERDGFYKIQYGIISEGTAGGWMDLARNGTAVAGSLVTPLTATGSTSGFSTLNLRRGDVVALRAGGALRLSGQGVNGFLMIESVS
jgi:hypothetical protein